MIMGLSISLFALMMVAVIGSLLIIIFSFHFGVIVCLLLFNALLEDAFAEVRDEWHKRAWSIQLGYTKDSILSNLRFADDVLLIATTLPQLTKLLSSLSTAAKKRGLELHQEKTITRR